MDCARHERLARRWPLGAAVSLQQLDVDPHPVLARLREHEPVSWLPSLHGWMVTRHDLALEAMRDDLRFTVDDPRFSTAQVIGPSMLSLDGPAHARHRAPFVGPFRAAAVSGRFAAVAADRARSLLEKLEPAGGGELRRTFAGPMSASIVARALGLDEDDAETVLRWYDEIVASVTEITVGTGATRAGTRAFAQLRARLRAVIAARGRSSLLAAAARDSTLTEDEIVSNAAVLLFGGIETTEGMIANALVSLLERPHELRRVRNDAEALDAAIDESLRLEPAAAVVDRYATADMTLGTAAIARGDLVRISIAGANRDPALFAEPDTFDPTRRNLRRHLAFAQGPHVCVGVHLARLEARTALGMLLDRLPKLRLDPSRPPVVRGLVFRKPPRVDVVWS
ncbi:MAG: cytochrome P450 [Solirubrobacteraceae bacterium]